MNVEHDETYSGSHKESGTATCAATECDVKIRYDVDASSRPRYCKKHTAEYKLKGRTEDDLRIKQVAIKRKSMQDIIDETVKK